MSEMVERVARAISEMYFSGATPDDWHIGQPMFELMARAAIAAMREPTEKMMRGKASTALIPWHEMIDSALES